MLGSQFGVPGVSEASNTHLILAAHMRARIAVVTDYGIQLGYLMGLDEQYAVLFGRYSRGEDEHYWTPMVVPRTQMMIIERDAIGVESEEVRERYLLVAGAFLKLVDEHIAELQQRRDNTSEENVS